MAGADTASENMAGFTLLPTQPDVPHPFGRNVFSQRLVLHHVNERLERQTYSSATATASEGGTTPAKRICPFLHAGQLNWACVLMSCMMVVHTVSCFSQN